MVPCKSLGLLLIEGASLLSKGYRSSFGELPMYFMPIMMLMMVFWRLEAWDGVERWMFISFVELDKYLGQLGWLDDRFLWLLNKEDFFFKRL